MSNGSFRVKRVRRADAQPIPFDFIIELPDPEQPDNEDAFIEEKHTFLAKPRVNGALLLDVAASGAEGGAYQALALKRFFSEVVVDEDRDRLQELLRRNDNPIETELLAELADYLLEKLADRPTDRPSS